MPHGSLTPANRCRYALGRMIRRRGENPRECKQREEWLAARLELLEVEKELTRRSDELARQRRPLPDGPICITGSNPDIIRYWLC